MKEEKKQELIKCENIDEALQILRTLDKEGNESKKEIFQLLTSFLNSKPELSNEFLELLFTHKADIILNIYKLNENLLQKAFEHDMDKVLNLETYEIYSKHFSELKKIPFGTEEYKQYEKKYFPKAHYNHNQSAHQFYCKEHEQDTKVSLSLLMEVIVDITSTAIRYGNTDSSSIAKIIYNKPKIKDFIAYETIFHTVEEIINNKNN